VTDSGGITSVSVQGMITAQGHFQNAVDTCNTAYNNMSEQQATLAANWTGEASSAFGQALNQYLEDLGNVRTQLSTMLETLSANTGVYSNTSEQSTDLANAFSTGLPGLTGI
jgi:WXG100 family type VII secretion target